MHGARAQRRHTLLLLPLRTLVQRGARSLVHDARLDDVKRRGHGRRHQACRRGRERGGGGRPSKGGKHPAGTLGGGARRASGATIFVCPRPGSSRHHRDAPAVNAAATCAPRPSLVPSMRRTRCLAWSYVAIPDAFCTAARATDGPSPRKYPRMPSSAPMRRNASSVPCGGCARWEDDGSTAMRQWDRGPARCAQYTCGQTPPPPLVCAWLPRPVTRCPLPRRRAPCTAAPCRAP